MTTISNDKQLRDLINGLDSDRQRTLGGRFAGSLLGITSNTRLQRAIEVASDADSTAEDIAEALKAARAVANDTYTACGRDADWMAQAEHFVARACAAALSPPEQLGAAENPAWKAAMYARMAKNCQMIETGEGEGETENEAQHQYEVAAAFGR
ncbi:MAG: hypothetical protein PVF91_16220 [Chromatiales bacterium]|jgi:hypothetical protein